MPKKLIIKTLDDIEWNKHIIGPDDETFTECLQNGEIEIGDIVTVENYKEYEMASNENEFVITFNKDFKNGSSFFAEEIFSRSECKVLFGEEFNY